MLLFLPLSFDFGLNGLTDNFGWFLNVFLFVDFGGAIVAALVLPVRKKKKKKKKDGFEGFLEGFCGP